MLVGGGLNGWTAAGGLSAAAILWMALGGTALCAAQRATGEFDEWSDGATLRVDYEHGGTAAGDDVSLDALVREGAWPGSRSRTVDALNLGAYRFEVRDRATRGLLYAAGFSSIYGEWQETEQAKTDRRTFHESLRFPFPRRPVQVDLLKRVPDGSWRALGIFLIDPADQGLRREAVTGRGTVWPVFENGPPQDKVDLLVLGDGYTAAEMPKFHADVRRFVGILFGVSPFRERRRDFNVRAIDLPSEDSGVDRPSDGVWRRTALHATYDVFGSERYALTLDNRTLRDVAAQAPYEFIEILLNGEKYGGGGIYNLFATCSTDSGSSPYVFVHEFGHHVAALADEYYTSDVAYDTTTPIVEPWEPNITALLDPAHLKWADLVPAGTPLPTPWGKEEYERHQADFQTRRKALRARHAPEKEMDALFSQELAWTKPFLAAPPYGGRLGAFEGAGYRAKGLYRPSTDCIMFTRNMDRFCPVCARAIERVIDAATGR